jgi:GDP/UDP-N,N'-diacetylbacillosamine 2-epimerase (hydrolysing)
VRLAISTTSRADYGIYQSLLSQCAADPDITYGLVVSGTHLSARHGRTVEIIERAGHPIWGRVPSVPDTDDREAIAAIIGEALSGFSRVWAELAAAVDVVICLGDRYEMFAAVAATVPFNLPVAHLHGGETTLGAIDDKFRHAITAMSSLHFTATEDYARRVAGIAGSKANVFTVGAPSLDGLGELTLPTVAEMKDRFGIDLSLPTILVTIHPETVNLAANLSLASCVRAAFPVLADRYQIVVTLPNADTEGERLRRVFADLADQHSGIKTIESFGKMGYFAAMKYSAFLLGNTSSGLLEAPSFGKYAINVGDRQKGRARSGNVIDVAIDPDQIMATVAALETQGLTYAGDNCYVQEGNAAATILRQLKAWKEGADAGADQES